jgi:hypothetical protein
VVPDLTVTTISLSMAKTKAIGQLHLYVYAHTVAVQAVISAYHHLKQAGQQSRGCNVEHLRLLC